MANGASIDDDTRAAVIAAWLADDTLRGLTAKPPQAGRLKPGQELPYCQVESVPERRELAGTKGQWFDYRKVTLTLWDGHDPAAAALRAMLAVFNRLTVLAYPSGAKFMRWWPTTGGRMAQDKDTKAGLDVWQATVEASVWSVRDP